MESCKGLGCAAILCNGKTLLRDEIKGCYYFYFDEFAIRQKALTNSISSFIAFLGYNIVASNV